MAKRVVSNESRYYEALRRISKDYLSPERIERVAEKKYGLSYHEALECAYENIQADAAEAIRGRKPPKEFGTAEKGESPGEQNSDGPAAPKT